MAKLHYCRDCVEIFTVNTQRRPKELQRVGHVHLSRLLPQVARVKAAFMEAKWFLWDKTGVQYGLLYPAKLRVTHRGKDKMFVDPMKEMGVHQREYYSSCEWQRWKQTRIIQIASGLAFINQKAFVKPFLDSNCWL